MYSIGIDKSMQGILQGALYSLPLRAGWLTVPGRSEAPSRLNGHSLNSAVKRGYSSIANNRSHIDNEISHCKLKHLHISRRSDISMFTGTSIDIPVNRHTNVCNSICAIKKQTRCHAVTCLDLLTDRTRTHISRPARMHKLPCLSCVCPWPVQRGLQSHNR